MQASGSNPNFLAGLAGMYPGWAAHGSAAAAAAAAAMGGAAFPTPSPQAHALWGRSNGAPGSATLDPAMAAAAQLWSVLSSLQVPPAGTGAASPAAAAQAQQAAPAGTAFVVAQPSQQAKEAKGAAQASKVGNSASKCFHCFATSTCRAPAS
jgi:S-DNA-T family DNA segregation ATPase FtsK/SpoIIIE